LEDEEHVVPRSIITDEIREEIKKFPDLVRMKAQPIRTYGTQQSPKWKVYAMNAYIKNTE
jgi:hypothetical protein